jgi:chromosome segregation ATPase
MIWIIVTIGVIVLAAVGFYTYKLFSFNESVINERKQLKHQKINLKQSLEKAQFDSEHIQKVQKDIEHYKIEQEKLIQSQIEFLNLREQKLAQKEDELQSRITEFEDEKLVFFQRLQGKEYCLNTGLSLLEQKYKMVAASTGQIRQQQKEMNNFHNIIDNQVEKLTRMFETTEELIEDLDFGRLLLLKEQNLLGNAKSDFLVKRQELLQYEENLNNQSLKLEENQRALEYQKSLLQQQNEQFEKEKSEIQDHLSEFDAKKQSIDIQQEKLQEKFNELTEEHTTLMKRIGALDAREKELEESARKLENWGQDLVNKEQEIKKWENRLQSEARELNNQRNMKTIAPEDDSTHGMKTEFKELAEAESEDLVENDSIELNDTNSLQKIKTDAQTTRNAKASIRLIKGSGGI